jgi:hypothetical protein
MMPASISYAFRGYDYVEALDGNFIIIKGNKVVGTQPTREAAKEWITKQADAQSAGARTKKEDE